MGKSKSTGVKSARGSLASATGVTLVASIRTSAEGARGCGYRAPGGKYLVSGAPSEACSKLPVELATCPCCGSGIKPSRAWTWITPGPLLDPGPHGSEQHDAVCPLGTAVDWSEGKR